MPLYVGDYLKDTAELTLAEHGAYLRLILFYWNNGGAITNDLSKIYRATGAISPQEQQNIASILKSYFVQNGDTFFHKRIDEELNKTAKIKAVRSKAGRRGGRKSGESRRSKSEANGIANANQTGEQTRTISPSPSPSPSLAQSTSGNTPYYPPAGDDEAKIIQKDNNHEKPKRNTTSPFPYGEQCPDEWANWAARNSSLTQSGIDEQYAIARDWALAKGERKADWLAFWRGWCRRVDRNASQQRDSFARSQKKSALAAAFDAVVAARESAE